MLKWLRNVDQKKNPGLSSGPIILTCFTNHALDQFLEKVMTKTKRIVRLGGRTKVEALKEFSLIEASKRSKINLGRNYYQYMDQQRDKLKDFEAVNIEHVQLIHVPIISQKIIKLNMGQELEEALQNLLRQYGHSNVDKYDIERFFNCILNWFQNL